MEVKPGESRGESQKADSTKPFGRRGPKKELQKERRVKKSRVPRHLPVGPSNGMGDEGCE